jgi:hypothetical protein
MKLSRSQPQSAFISFYDEHGGQVKFCVVPRQFFQSTIDRVPAISVPPDAPEHSDIPTVWREIRTSPRVKTWRTAWNRPGAVISGLLAQKALQFVKK